MDIIGSLKRTEQKVIEMCKTGSDFESLTFQAVKEMLLGTGLDTLPSEHKKNHYTRECYFQTQDGVICHLIITPFFGYKLDVLSSNAEEESTALRQLKDVLKVVPLAVAEVLRGTLEKLDD